MVDTTLANRLAPHCRPGPVLDLLAAATTDVGRDPLRGAPSDVIARRIIRRDAAQAEAVIASITSGDLLLRIARTERRKHVLKALAKNPHLPAEGIALLADRAERQHDEELATALTEGRTQRDLALLLLDHPQLRLLLEHGGTTLAYALRNARDEQLLLRAVGDLRTLGLRELLKALTFDHEDVVGSPDTLITLAVNAGLDGATGPENDVVRAVLPDHATPEVQRRALTELGWQPVRGRLIEMIAAGTSPLRLADVLAGAPAEQMPPLIHRIGSARIVVDTEIAELIDVPTADARAHLHLQATPEASARLAASANPKVAAVHLLRLPDAAQRIPCTSGLITQQLTPTLNQVADLAEAGLPDEWLLRFVLQLLESHAQVAEHAPLRARLLPVAPADVLVKLKLTAADLPVLLGRPDVADVGAALRKLLTDVDLGDRDRRDCAAALPGATLAEWVTGTGGRNRPAAGDIAWLVEHARDREAFVVSLGTRMGVFAAGGWIADVVRVVPLDWRDVRSATALRALMDLLHEAFGDDLEAWQAVLTLLPTWAGSGEQLVDTTRAVLARAA